MKRRLLISGFCLLLLSFLQSNATAQTLAFPGAQGFGRYAPGARGVANPQVYVVNNLNNSGPGSFRDAVSQPGRVVVFAVSGIINLTSDIVVPPNTTIAGQTAPGEGIVLFGKRVTFSSSSNTIARFIRIRLGATDNSGKDASGISNGANMIFDHMTFTWGMDEVFSINWDGKGTSPDNITIQNSIIGQALHRVNHSAGGLIQPSNGGKVSLIGNLYISNKTRNPKVKGINEFVNNVVYNWGNYGNTYGHTQSGEAYIMGGDSEGVSEVNIINNYFISGPYSGNKTTPFNRGNSNFNLYGPGNFYDNNKNGILDGDEVTQDLTGFPVEDATSIKSVAYDYPAKNTTLTAVQAYDKVVDSAGASFPRRDQVDSLMIADLLSKGTQGSYVYRESDLPFSNGGVGHVYNAPAPLDSDNDGMPDAWEDAKGLNKNNPADAVSKTLNSNYLNIEVYVNSLPGTTPPAFVIPPSDIAFTSSSQETPPSSIVTISWKDNSGDEDGFVLERSTNGTSWTSVATVSANIKTYTDNNLVPNTVYHYRVKAISGSESSAWSASASLTTPPIPTAPTKTTSPSPTNNQEFVEPTSGNLDLKWKGSSNTATYSVYFGTDADALTKIGDVAYVTSPSFQVTGLSPSTSYFWRVDAVNDKGTTTGDVWTFKTLSAVPQGMVGYWAFDETLSNGLQITDSTSYENHGVLGLDDDDASIRVVGKVKNALSFASAATDRYVVSIPSQDQLYLSTGSFSLSFWMKAAASLLPQDNNSSAYLLCKGSITKNSTTGATGKRFDIEFKNKQLRFAIDDDVQKRELQYTATEMFNNEWQHVVVIRDVATSKLRLFVNGIQVKEVDGSNVGGIGEDSDLILGNIGELEFLANANAPAPYKGELDEFKVFNYVLNDQQVMEQYYTSPLPFQAYKPAPSNESSTLTVNEADLTWLGGLKTTTYKLYLGTDSTNLAFVANINVSNPNYQLTNLTGNTSYFWRVDAVGPAGTTVGDVWSFTTAVPKGRVANYHFDASSGTTLTDNSTYANHGNLNSVGAYTWSDGKLNNGLELQTMAANSAISIPDQNQIKFDRTSFSVSLWMKASAPASNSTSAYLFHKGTFSAANGGTGKWYGVEFKNNQVYFSVDDNVNKSTAQVSNTGFFTNEWVHLVFVRNVDDQTLKIYLNNTLIKTATENSSSLANGIGTTNPFVLANNQDLNAPFTGALDEMQLFNYAISPEQIQTLSEAQPATVGLISFQTSVSGPKIKLNWRAATEPDSIRYEVERSLDGVNFSSLLKVAAKGVEDDQRNYVKFDEQPQNGLNYYRLLQYDQNGDAEVLAVQTQLFESKSGKKDLQPVDMYVYPNPITQNFSVFFPQPQSTANITLRNMSGAVVYETALSQIQGGAVALSLNTKPAPGMYVLEVQTVEEKKIFKVLVRD